MNPMPTVTPEVRSLIEAVCDGMANDVQVRNLESLLLADEEARNFYVDLLDLDAKLQRLVGSLQEGDAALREFIAFELMSSQQPTPAFVSTTLHTTLGYFSEGMPLAYLLATMIVGVGLLIGSQIYVSGPEQVAWQLSPATNDKGTHDPQVPFVGRITGMVDCRWSDPQTEAHNGASVPLGRKYALSSGLMEITYDTGAKVILQGPMAYEVESKNGGFLPVGKLTGKVEVEGAKGFAVRTPTAIMTDLGTEFGVEVDKSGITTSHVFRGTVKVQVVTDGGAATNIEHVLRENESARVDGDGADRKIVVNPTVNHEDFIREIPKRKTRVFDLVDVVAGGDGFSGRRNAGIDPKNGQIIRVLPWEVDETASVTDRNLLQKMTVTASSEFEGDRNYSATKAVDGQPAVNDWASAFTAGVDTNPRLVVSGFNSAIRTIRIWGNSDIPIRSVTIRSSTTRQTSLNASAYETELVPTTTYADMSDWTHVGGVGSSCYKDYAVIAPTGTQSVFFGFNSSSGTWVRVQELQAFSHPTPMSNRLVSGVIGRYHRVEGLPLIDGVFVPGARPVQMDSMGHMFAGFGATVDQSPFFTWALGKNMTTGPKTTLGGVDYASPGHGLLFMPANQGITFDLDAVRRANPGWRPLRFRTLGGNAEPRADSGRTVSADLWVLVDGQVRFRRREVNGWSGMCPIIFPIATTDRFLTLVATDGENGTFRDWIVFGDPRLELEPAKAEAGSTSQ